MQFNPNEFSATRLRLAELDAFRHVFTTTLIANAPDSSVMVNLALDEIRFTSTQVSGGEDDNGLQPYLPFVSPSPLQVVETVLGERRCFSSDFF